MKIDVYSTKEVTVKTKACTVRIESVLFTGSNTMNIVQSQRFKSSVATGLPVRLVSLNLSLDAALPVESALMLTKQYENR